MFHILEPLVSLILTIKRNIHFSSSSIRQSLPLPTQPHNPSATNNRWFCSFLQTGSPLRPLHCSIFVRPAYVVFSHNRHHQFLSLLYLHNTYLPVFAAGHVLF